MSAKTPEIIPVLCDKERKTAVNFDGEKVADEYEIYDSSKNNLDITKFVENNIDKIKKVFGSTEGLKLTFAYKNLS